MEQYRPVFSRPKWEVTKPVVGHKGLDCFHIVIGHPDKVVRGHNVGTLFPKIVPGIIAVLINQTENIPFRDYSD